MVGVVIVGVVGVVARGGVVAGEKCGVLLELLKLFLYLLTNADNTYNA